MPNRIDTVIFDLDQTLLDKDRSLLGFAGYQYERFSLGSYISAKQDYLEAFSELNHMTMPKEEVYEQIGAIFGIGKSVLALLLDDLNRNFHVYSVGFPGLHPMLDTLKDQGYKLGIITNGRDFYQRNKIAALGIGDYFSVIVTSGAVHVKKPDHAIFRLALNQLHTSSERSVFIGDNLQADIAPAKELGMYTILKSNRYHPLPAACCDDLSEIPNIINRFNS